MIWWVWLLIALYFLIFDPFGPGIYLEHKADIRTARCPNCGSESCESVTRPYLWDNRYQTVFVRCLEAGCGYRSFCEHFWIDDEGHIVVRGEWLS